MRTVFLVLPILLATMIVGCMKREPKFDQFVGRTESEIKTRFGRPTSEQVGSSLELLKGELAYELRNRVPPGSEVKEISFSFRSGERIFWLVSSSNIWTVVADVQIPPGVTF